MLVATLSFIYLCGVQEVLQIDSYIRLENVSKSIHQ